MSEKSFAVVSIATAVVWGVFFYPPPPPERVQQSSKAGFNSAPRDVPPQRIRVADIGERAWWRKKLAQLKPSSSLHP